MCRAYTDQLPFKVSESTVDASVKLLSPFLRNADAAALRASLLHGSMLAYGPGTSYHIQKDLSLIRLEHDQTSQYYAKNVNTDGILFYTNLTMNFMYYHFLGGNRKFMFGARFGYIDAVKAAADGALQN